MAKTDNNGIKKKLFILCIIVGIGCLLLGGAGFLQINSVQKSVSNFEEKEDRISGGNYWDALNQRGCDALLGKQSCYCAKADNVDDCVDEYLTNPPKGYDEQFHIFAVNRYVFLIVSLGCFVGAWIFHENRKKVNKEN